MKQSVFSFTLLLLFLSCNRKEKEAGESGAFFPVRSYLQSQVKEIDTSLYNLRRVENRNGRKDTMVIPREAFRKEAADFLNIEDIAGKAWKDDYQESRLYDDILKRAIFSYTPTNKDAPILRQDVTIEPGAGGDAAVKTIFINRLKDEKDSTVQKRLLWEVGRRFQVTTTVSRNGKPDEDRTLEVWWAPFPSAE